MAQNSAFPNISMPIAMRGSNTCTQTWYQFFISLWLRTGAQQGGNVASAGDIKPIAGPTTPDGWTRCDGSAISRTTYSNLFAAIGTTWGSGDGSSTFNVPDFRARMLIGAGGDFDLGDTGGHSTATLAIANLVPHSHVIYDEGHIHSIPTGTAAGSGAFNANVDPATTTDTGASLTGVSTTSTGEGQPFSILPPYAAINWVIKL